MPWLLLGLVGTIAGVVAFVATKAPDVKTEVNRHEPTESPKLSSHNPIVGTMLSKDGGAMAILGSGGEGKSTLMSSVILEWPYEVHVIDTLGQLRFKTCPPNVHYRAIGFNWRALPAKTLIVIDEIDRVASKNYKVQKWILDILNCARPFHEYVLWTARRPASLASALGSHDADGLARWFALFAPPTPYDAAWIEGRIGRKIQWPNSGSHQFVIHEAQR